MRSAVRHCLILVESLKPKTLRTCHSHHCMITDEFQTSAGKRRLLSDEVHDEGKERAVRRRTGERTPSPPMIRPTLLNIVTNSTTLQKLANAAAAEAQSTPSDQEDYTPDSDDDSLFGPSSEAPSILDDANELPSTSTRLSSMTTLDLASPDADAPYGLASRSTPPIPGLFFDPTLCLPDDLADEVMSTCMQMYFRDSGVDQVMLFERAGAGGASSLPSILTTLLSTLSTLLRPILPLDKYALLFPPAPTPFARQAILNLYWPGDGITPHVDLLDRYGDGIIGVSFGSGCVMCFAEVLKGRGDEPASQRVEELASQASEWCGVYLPPGSVIVMTDEARYAWTHGIEMRMEDMVESEDEKGSPVLLERDVRLSVTFRWLLPGADVVGDANTREV